MKFLCALVLTLAIASSVSANKQKKCYPIEEACKGENQEYSPTLAGCQQNCNNLGVAFKCAPKAGCVCKKGYVRSKDNKSNCIKVEACPKPACLQDIVVGPCKAAFSRWAYSSAQGKCVQFTYGGCSGNDNRYDTEEDCKNSCRRYIKEQPTCAKAFEVYSACNVRCQKTCENKDGPIRCPKICAPGCVCQDGYVRNDKGDCVKPIACPTKTPACLQEIVVGPCEALIKSWAFDNFAKKCVEFNYGGCQGNENRYTSEKACQNACREYVPKCKANEAYTDCGSACPKTCDNKDNKELACPAVCVSGCFCNDGYVRDKSGNCILEKQCPAKEPPACTGEFEIRSGCETRCNGGKICVKIAAGGLLPCFCKEGYSRLNGKCVPAKQCPAKEPPACTGEFEIRTGCETDCKNRRKCAAVAEGGFPPCHCREGYRRNDQRKCVLAKECPAQEVCKANEVYTTCGTACPKTCDNKDSQIICTKQCVMGCFCSNGYVRDKSGNCILEKQCPAKEPPACTGKFEIRTGCQTDCNGATLCASIVEGGFPPCFCKEGYRRNDQGNCVLPEQCPANEVCPANAAYTDCGTACPKTCDNKDNKELACTLQCVTGCFCNQGYVLDKDGKCILENQCPAKEVCPANEAYNNCGTACQRTCKNKDLNQICTKQCVKGCFCSKGFVRNDAGVCIKENQCPAIESKAM